MTTKDVKLFSFPTGYVTELDIYGLIEQDAYIYSVLLTGQQLKDTLEISINSVNNSNATDFLHVSGKLCTVLCILCTKCINLIHNGEVMSVPLSVCLSSKSNIICQHPVALVNGLIYMGNREGATSCRAMLSPFYNCHLYNMFRPYKVIIREILLCSFFTVLCCCKAAFNCHKN
jgi:hypothetical protein